MSAHLSAFFKTMLALIALAVVYSAFTAAMTLRGQVRQPVQSPVNASAELDAAASHIEVLLVRQGYSVERQRYQHEGQQIRSLEVSIKNARARQPPERTFIVGACYDPTQGAGTAVVLELARMLKDTPLRRGTEIRFVFFVNEQLPPASARSFIAFVGSADESAQMRKPLSAFQGAGLFSSEFHTVQRPHETPDYQSTARAVEAMAKAIAAMAGPQRM